MIQRLLFKYMMGGASRDEMSCVARALPVQGGMRLKASLVRQEKSYKKIK